MSYDLSVFASKAIPGSALVELIRSDPAVEVEESGSAPGFVMVVRGMRRAYCFTVEGPLRIEDEDVPTEIIERVLGASVQYTIAVEGSAPAAVPVAVRFAKKLAQAVNGALLNHQTDEVFGNRTARTVVRPKDTRISTIKLLWYHRPGAANMAAAYLALARRYLPEALPRRFGVFEPFSQRLDSDGDSAFIALAQKDFDQVYFSGALPSVGGSIPPNDNVRDTRFGPIRATTLTVVAATFTDERWSSALNKFFLRYAEEAGCFFATAEVQRNVGWNGRSVWFDSSEDTTTYLAQKGHWLGAADYPMWWTWLGTEYTDLLSSHEPRSDIISTAGSMFHSWADAPLDRDHITELLEYAADKGLKLYPLFPPDMMLREVEPAGISMRKVERASIIPPALEVKD